MNAHITVPHTIFLSSQVSFHNTSIQVMKETQIYLLLSVKKLCVCIQGVPGGMCQTSGECPLS